MKLAIALMLALSCLAVIPDSRGQDVTPNAKSKQKPAELSIVEKQPTSRPDQRARSQDIETTNKQYPIAVKELPPKDVWDKVYVILTGVLVGVGIATLVAIWRQAVETRKAAQAARDNVEQMKVQTDILKKSVAADIGAGLSSLPPRRGEEFEQVIMVVAVGRSNRWLVRPVRPHQD